MKKRGIKLSILSNLRKQRSRAVLTTHKNDKAPLQGSVPAKGATLPTEGKSLFYRLGQFVARARVLYLQGLYSVHLKQRYLHDKTYQKGGWYKSWTDKPYSSSVHKASLFAFIISFVAFSVIQNVFPYLNLGRPNTAMAGSNTVTWTTKGDFENNDITTGSATTSNLINLTGDTASSDSSIEIKPSFGWSSATSETNKPSARYSFSGALTDSGLIIWGGNAASCSPACPLNTGATYNIASNSWTATATVGAPAARINHTATSTGTKMIIWAGKIYNSSSISWDQVNTGGVYDPATDSWTATSTTNAPSARSGHTAIWTGSKMVIWGGAYINGSTGATTPYNTGGVYDPATDTWTATSTTNAPSARSGHTAIWTGSKMVIWGGGSNTGGVYDPVTDTWTATSTTNAPSARSGHTAIWTGSKMVIWGGYDGSNYLNTGGIYDPATNVWTATSIENPPSIRTIHGAIWTGSKMVIWGGYNGSTYLNTGSVYDPATDSWTATPTTNALSARINFAFIWSGNKAIIWGGSSVYNLTQYTDGRVGVESLYTSGTISNLKINAQSVAKWATISWNGTTPANTAIKFRTRSAATEAGLTSATWSSYYTSSGSAITSGSSQWLEIEMTLESSDGASTPTLNDFSVSYDTLEAPVNTNTNIKKTDGSFLKDSTGNTITAGTAGGWTNETSAKVITTGLSCTGCGTFTNPYIEVETKPVGTAFDGTTGITVGSVDGGNQSTATLTNLTPGTGYHIQMRTKDAQGRVSGWTAYGANDESSADVSIDQVAPTGTVSINAGAQFATSTTANLTLSATDTGGSTLGQMRFSNDGTTWSDWEAYATPKSDWDLSAYGGNADDGEKTVYVQFRDDAGNVSNNFSYIEKFLNTTYKDATSTADWNTTLNKIQLKKDTNFTANWGVLFANTSISGIDRFDVGDLDGDGDFDLMRPNGSGPYDGIIYGYRNDGTNAAPVFTAVTGWNTGANDTIAATNLVDVDGDGDLDLYKYTYVSDTSRKLYLHINNSVGNGPVWGTGSLVGTFTVAAGAHYTFGISDLDKDGKFDVLIADAVTDNVAAAYRNTGTNLSPVWTRTAGWDTPNISYGGIGNSIYFALGDIDGDGDDDLVSSTAYSGNVYRNDNVGNGPVWTYVAGWATPSNGGMGNSPAFYDYNRDGLADYFMSNSGSAIKGYANNGTYSYVTPGTAQSLTIDSTPETIKRATFTATQTLNGQTISYYLSADGGSHWEGPITSGTQWTFTNSGSNLKWKAVLSGTTSITPELTEISMIYSADPYSDSITLDTQPPTAFTISSPANNTYSSTEASPTFSWAASSGHSKYQLVIDDEVDKDNIDSGATSTTPTAPLSEGSYSWNIKAIDSAGNETLASNGPFAYTYDTTVPGNVQNLIAPQGQATTTSITVSWDAVTDSGSGIDRYTLERKRSDDDWTGSLYDTYVSYELSEITKTDTGLEVGRRYNYRIKAYDKAGLSSADYTTVDGFTTDTVDPSYPSSVNVTACTVDGTNCSTADNPNPEAGYETKITWTKATDSGVGVTGYKIYRTTVVNSFNESDFTLVGYLDIAVPGSEANSLTYYDNDTNNDATFTDTTYDPNTGTEGIQPIKSTASPRLNDYVTYYYRVNAIDESGNERDLIPGPLEYAVNYDSDPERTVDVTAPSVPADLTATATGVDTENNDPLTQGVTIDWSISTDTRTPGRTPAGNGSGVDYYSLYRASGDINGPTEGFVVIPEAANLEVATYPDKGLLENAYYYYKVMATDVATNTSELSSYAQVRTRDSSVPTTPTAVYVKSVTGDPNSDPDVGTKVNVSFVGSKIKVAENEVRGYRIYRSTTNLPTAAQWTVLEPVHTISGLTISGETQDPGDDGCSDYTLGGVVYGDNEGIRCFTDTVPTDATTYYYKVMSYGYNASNQENVESSLSSITPGTISSGWDTAPDATAPDQPAEVTVKDIHGNTSLYRNIVTWQMIATPERNGVNDFAKYQVYRYETFQGIGTATLIAEKTDIGDNYHVDGISSAEADTDFSYYVVALDNAATAFKYATTGTPIINNYANSSGYSGTVAINPAIAKPTVSNTASSNVGVSSATITWTTDQPCDSLVEYRVKDTNTVKAAGGDRTTPVTSHTIGLVGLEKGKTYQYRIVSRNSLGNIDATAATTWGEFTTENFVLTHNKSTDVSLGSSSVTISWTSSLDADSQVEFQMVTRRGVPVSEESDGAFKPGVYTKNHEVSFGVIPSSKYVYKIRSITEDGYMAEYPTSGWLDFTTPADDNSQFTVSPDATKIAEENITATSARIVWESAVPTTSWLDYGTSSKVYTMSAGDDQFNTHHVVDLKNLTPGQKYYYIVRGKDTNENEYISSEYTFTAILKPEVTVAKVENVTSYSADIVFNTNVDTEASVIYGKSQSLDQQAGINEFKRNHQISLNNLEDGVTYYYQISIKDKLDNNYKTSMATFATPIDKEGAKVENLKIDILPMGETDEFASVILSWNTNKPTSTKVEYDEGAIGSKYGSSTIEDISLNTSHTVIIKELNPSATYRFKIAGRDRRGNTTNSNSYTFVTPEKNKSIWQLIVRSLEETFSWVSNVGGFFRGLGSKFGG